MTSRFTQYQQSRLKYELDELGGLIGFIHLKLRRIILKKDKEGRADIALCALYEYSWNSDKNALYFSYTIFCKKLVEYVNKQKSCGVVMLEICEIEKSVGEVLVQLAIVNSLSPDYAFD